MSLVKREVDNFLPALVTGEVLIGSSDFVEYLLQPPWYIGRKDLRFSSCLDLGFCSGIIESLYSNSVTVDVFSAEEKEKMLGTAQIIAKMSGGKESEWAELAVKRSLGERGCFLCHERKTGVFGASQINFGNYAEATYNIFELMDNGFDPLIEFHTHPTDFLFSPIDYTSLLTDYYEGGVRLVPALVVLCRNVQVLALPTPQTPFLDLEKLEEFIRKWDGELVARNSEIESLFAQRSNLVTDAITRKAVSVQETVDNLIVEVNCNPEFADLPKEKKYKRFEEISQPFLRQLEDCEKRARRIGGKLVERVLVEKYKMNSILIECARSVGIKLYFSTDRRIFKEFTA